MFQLLVAESNQGFESGLVSQPVLVAELEDLGIDVTLNESEDICICSTWIWLRYRFSASERVGKPLLDVRQAVRQELLVVLNFLCRMTSSSMDQRTRFDAAIVRGAPSQRVPVALWIA